MKSEIIRYGAYTLMIYDHICAVFFPEKFYLRIPSAIVFPIFCWFCVVSLNNTRNVALYISGLVGLALISQYPVQYAMGKGNYNDIMWLALGTCIIWLAREYKSNILILIALIACVVTNLRAAFVAITIMAIVNAIYEYLPTLTRESWKYAKRINYIIYPLHLMIIGGMREIF